MVHIKEPLLLIEKSNPCGGSGFPMYVITKSYVLLAISKHAIGCGKSLFFLLAALILCDVIEQHTYSATIETLLVCKH